MSDRIAVMSQGKVLQMGPAVEIYERPTSRFVADFIGEANFLDGRVKSLKGENAVVTIPAWGTDLAGLSTTSVKVGEDVAVSIRPEKVRLDGRTGSGTELLGGRCQHQHVHRIRHARLPGRQRTARQGLGAEPDLPAGSAVRVPRGRQGLDHASSGEHAGPGEGLRRIPWLPTESHRKAGPCSIQRTYADREAA